MKVDARMALLAANENVDNAKVESRRNLETDCLRVRRQAADNPAAVECCSRASREWQMAVAGGRWLSCHIP